MIVTINAQRKIYAVQEDFNRIFPYLKLGFFLETCKKGGGLLKRMLNPGNWQQFGNQGENKFFHR